MMDRMIFERGNAAVRSESLRPDERWVAVDKSGLVEAYSERPVYGFGGAYWYSSLGRHRPIAHVGEECPDWRDLLFEVEQPAPIAPAEIWAALKTLHGEPIAGVAWDKNGKCYAYRESPSLESSAWWCGGGYFRVATLDDLWTGDWRESWTPRPAEAGDPEQGPPEIDAETAGAIRTVYPGARWVVWNTDGCAYTTDSRERPEPHSMGRWKVYGNARFIPIPALNIAQRGEGKCERWVVAI
jgi:hypothetical protein